MQIKLYEPGDETAINDAFNQVFHAQRSLDEWWWKFNPEHHPVATVAAWDGEQLIAHNGGLSCNFHVDGREIKALQGVDTMSLAAKRRRPEWRSAWRQVMDFFADEVARPRGVGLLYGFTGGPAIRHMLTRARWNSVPPRRIPLLTRVARPQTRTMRSMLYVARLAADDEPCLDGLWRRLRRRYPASVVRDAAHFRRRFSGHPTVSYHRYIVSLRFSRRPVACVVFRTDGGVCRWADLVWDDRHPGALELVNTLSSRLALQTGAAQEAMWLDGDAAAERRLRTWGFDGDFDPSGVVRVVRFLDEALSARSFEAGRVYTTMADADLV